MAGSAAAASASPPSLVEERIGCAEAALAGGDPAAALALLRSGRPAAARSPRLALRSLLVEASAELAEGRARRAVEVLEEARAIAEAPGGTDADRAEVFFRLGCCRLTLGAPANAASLLTLALDLCDRSAEVSDRLRIHILDWRSRCYQRQRDWQAARADVERALELAHDVGDGHVVARAAMQASIVAEREGDLLLARFHAEHARNQLRSLGDEVALGKVLNNLGGIHFLLGDADRAKACLDEALRLATLRDNDVDAGYALSSLAQVRLRTGDPAGAVAAARRALERLAGRDDHANEVAGTEIVLARALLELGRTAEAEAACERAEAVLVGFGSASHSAAAWVAAGDVARAGGDLERAADLYRRAAEALQDLHF
ncbi:MAG TPA: tetratricopeptide repeat protein [Gaiellaceae bacterium]|nr:tetratricopeptide repeat protein [Gaiellaceae bacterium]